MTEFVFILDRSGSMSGLENDTIGGFNSMLLKQREEPGDCRITTVLFDDRCEILHDRIDIGAVGEITSREYFVRGSTALLDAVGKTILKIGGAQKNTAEEYRAEKVLFVITTDGYENASREFSYCKVKSMIENRKKRYGWEFIFLGANIDAAEAAGRFGIARNRAQNYCNDGDGIALNFRVVGETLTKYRATRAFTKIGDDWNAEIERDYKERGVQQSKRQSVEPPKR